MQPPFAAWINESIADQGLQKMLPACSLPTVGQTVGPELIEPQLFVQFAGQPTSSPLSRPMQFHLFEPDLHPKVSGEVRQLPIRRKQCQCHGPLALLIEDFNRSTPAMVLSVVDLAKVEHLPLDHLATPAAPILHHAPVAMLFSVLIRAWHLKNITATDFTLNWPAVKRPGLHYSHSGTPLPLLKRLRGRLSPKNSAFWR